MTSISTKQEIERLESLLATLQAENTEGGGSSPLLPAIVQIMQMLTSLQEDGKVTTPAIHTEPTPHSSPSDGPTNSQMCNALAELAGALTQLQVLIGKYGQDREKMNNSNMQNMIKQAESQIDQAQKDLRKIQEAQNHRSFWDIFLKVVAGIVGAIFTAVALTTGQFALAFVIMALTVAAETGAFDKGTKFVSEMLQSMGIPKEEADIIASVLVILVTIIATVATCGAAAPEAAAAAADSAIAETAAETAQQVIQGAATTFSEGFQSSTQALRNIAGSIKNAISKILQYNPFNKLSTTANLGILAGSQAVSGSNFAQNLALAIPGLSSKEREKLQKLLEIILNIICTIATAGSGAGAAAGGVAASTGSNFGQALRAMNVGSLGFQTLSAAGSIRLATIDAQIAELQAALGNHNAGLALFQTMMKMIDSSSQNSTQFVTKVETTHAQGLTTLLADLPKAGQALARVLSA